MIRRISLCAAALSTGLVFFFQTSAGATTWISPFDQVEGYYMPGPPPGGYLSACYVQSMNGSNGPGPIAYLNPQKTVYSNCSGGHVAVFFQIPGGIGESASLYVAPDTGLTIAGPDGDGDIGGAFNACNTSGYCLAWATTWISGRTEDGVSSGIHSSKVKAAFATFLAATEPLMPHPYMKPSIRPRWIRFYRDLGNCMRSYGVVDFPNPPSSFGDGHTSVPLIGAAAGDLDVSSMRYQSAAEHCNQTAHGIPPIEMRH